MAADSMRLSSEIGRRLSQAAMDQGNMASKVRGQDFDINAARAKAEDERNYAIYTEDYQDALRVLDAESDRILRLRKEETDPELIDRHNKELEKIRLKKMALLSEADLVEDLQKFY